MTRIKLILLEILRPSDRDVAGRVRRLVRRSIVLFFSTIPLLVAAVWVYSLTQHPDRPKWNLRWHDKVFSVHTGPVARLDVVSETSAILVTAWNGRLTYLFYCEAARKDAAPPTADFEFLGLQWRQLTCHSCPPTAFGRDGALPLWMPFVLFMAWPITAFFRGPYRRAKRRAKGLCRICGYNLTGSVEPPCPECGTRMRPKQINQVMSASVQD